ncbi:GntR family transcriptional regulator [soil metagenome]
MTQNKSSNPLYIQIAENLLKQIEQGELTPGQCLPPERTLSKTLHVNRMTLRQALQLLEAQGLLMRKQGVGTFVTESKVEWSVDTLAPFTKNRQHSIYKPGIHLISVEQRMASITVAQKLHLSISAPIYQLHRLRTMNQQASVLEEFTVSAQRFPNFDQHALAEHTIYAIMETEYGITVIRTQRSLEAVAATAYEAQWLGVEPGAPLLLEERVGFDQTGQPVEYSKDLYRGDRFRFMTETTLT